MQYAATSHPEKLNNSIATSLPGFQVADNSLSKGIKVTQTPLEDTENHSIINARIVMHDEVESANQRSAVPASRSRIR